jgi:hypothetical protein
MLVRIRLSETIKWYLTLAMVDQLAAVVGVVSNRGFAKTPRRVGWGILRTLLLV